MMSARLLRKQTSHSKIYKKSEQFFDSLTQAYNRSLQKFIERKLLAIPIFLLTVGLIVFLWNNIASELAPLEDKSRIRIVSTAPEGTSFEAMDGYMSKLITLVDTLPEKEFVISVTAPGGMGAVNSGFLRIGFTQPNERQRSQQQLTDLINPLLKKYNFARSYAMQEQTIGGGMRSGLPVQFVIQAPDFESLKTVVPQFMEKAMASKVFQVVDINLKFNKPELRIEIDRDKARSLGVSVHDIAESMQLYFSGQRYGYFIYHNKQYQVIGQAFRVNRDDPSDFSQVYVRSNTGKLIQLSELVKVSTQSSPPQLYRFNRYVAATISAQAAKGLTIGQGIVEMNRIADETLSDQFSTSLAGTSREFAESSGSLLYAFLFALILIYLVLAAQFESFRDPLIIMITVPLAMAGALLSLYVFGQTLNIFSQIGIIVLVGIVTKNGILIVEFANQRKEGGLGLIDAVIDAATQRLRPILMTSLATMLGALPIALALGAAAKSRASMGISIIGGLLLSLLLTLYIVPAMYAIISKGVKK
jgi:multidrug efflux pump